MVKLYTVGEASIEEKLAEPEGIDLRRAITSAYHVQRAFPS